jgi:DNA polymerase gamma 1
MSLRQRSCSTTNTYYNAFNIQMLPDSLRKQLFPDASSDQKTPVAIIDVAKKHLTAHSIPFNERRAAMPDLPATSSKLFPDLIGKNIAEHFSRMGELACRPWRGLSEEAALWKIPKIPPCFSSNVGWTFYPSDKPDQPVYLKDKPPDESILVFDTESSWSLSKYPLFAVALGKAGWYSWTSLAVHSQSDKDCKLIDIGEPEREQLIIGHNVSFDRISILEEYRLEENKRRFVDTMSLHVAVAGLSSQQRPAWNMNKKTCEAEEGSAGGGDNKEIKWAAHSSMNNLADAVKLHCGAELDKSDVKLLIDATWPSLLENSQRILQYCARDVAATTELFKELWKKYTKNCSHPVSQAAMFMMGSMILPVDRRWPEYIERCEKGYQQSIEEG